MNVNDFVKDYDYFVVIGLVVSLNGNLFVYGEDMVSCCIYIIKVKDLSIGKMLLESFEGIEGEVVWVNDNKIFYYIKKDL